MKWSGTNELIEVALKKNACISCLFMYKAIGGPVGAAGNIVGAAGNTDPDDLSRRPYSTLAAT